MENSVFIADLTEEVGNLTMVDSLNCFKYEKYSIRSFLGEPYIIGGKRLDTQSDPVFRRNPTKFDGPQLLFSLINLVKTDKNMMFDNKWVNESISDKDIMEWIEKYGFPYIEKVDLKDIESREILEIEKYLLKASGVHLHNFKRKIAYLYGCFNLWNAIYEEDVRKIEKFKKSVSVRLMWRQNRSQILSGKTEDLILLNQALSDTINFNSNIKIEVNYNEKTANYGLTLTSHSLVDIAYYQLSSLMTKSPSENKKKMKTCSSCNSIYWANHANSKYCSNCDRRTEWSRKNKKASL